MKIGFDKLLPLQKKGLERNLTFHFTIRLLKYLKSKKYVFSYFPYFVGRSAGRQHASRDFRFKNNIIENTLSQK